MVTWPAFPNRISFYYEDNPYPFFDSTTTGSGLSVTQQQQMADTGTVDSKTMGNILQDCACNPYPADPTRPPAPVPPLTSGDDTTKYSCGGSDVTAIPYAPYGPRGWLDEYCEMTKLLDDNGNIVKLHFTCENPEYWHTLWGVDQDRVVEIYRQTLQNDNVQLKDLILYGNDGEPVIDPWTGRVAYDPLNKWNLGMDLRAGNQTGDRGTLMTADAGGAMHLTSTPNTLQTELQLASGATVQRDLADGNVNGSELICCGQYGQVYRNSDPHIGQVVGLQFRVSLANPIGLYIQMPDFTAWTLPTDKKIPQDARPEELWHIVRGAKNLPDFPPSMNFLLHVRVEIPKRWKDAGADPSLTVSDILINGSPIQYASQIMQTFNVALFPLGVKADSAASKLPCVAPADPADPAGAFPQQIMYANVWDAYYGTTYTIPWRRNGDGSQVTMDLASNSVIIAPKAIAGANGKDNVIHLALAGTHFTEKDVELPSVAFILPESVTKDTPAGEVDPNISVKVTGLETVVYAVPGNSEPGEQSLLRLEVSIKPAAVSGSRDIRIVNPTWTGAPPPAGKWFLEVIASS